MLSLSYFNILIPLKWIISYSSFFQNEVIFIQLDELDELDSVTHEWIGFSYSLTQAQKTF